MQSGCRLPATALHHWQQKVPAHVPRATAPSMTHVTDAARPVHVVGLEWFAGLQQFRLYYKDCSKGWHANGTLFAINMHSNKRYLGLTASWLSIS